MTGVENMKKRLQVILDSDEWDMMEELKIRMGIRNSSDIIRHLIRKELRKNENE